MKGFIIFAMEAVATGLIVLAGLSGKIPLIGAPRGAVIALGIVGIAAFCTISVGKFISAAPAHPFTIAGYVLGGVAMLAFLAQVFQWRLPVIGDAKAALFVLAGCILVKSIVARIGIAVLKL